MITNQDASEYVIQAIEAGYASRNEFNIDGIVSELYDVYDNYDFALIDPMTFWQVVENHFLGDVPSECRYGHPYCKVCG